MMSNEMFVVRDLAERLNDSSVWSAYMERCMHGDVCCLIGLSLLCIVVGICVLYGLKKSS